MKGRGVILWVDADACPRDAKEIVFRASQRLQLPVKLVACQVIHAPSSELIERIGVPGSPDAADDRIVELVSAGDLVVTDDVPLAARVVEKGAVALTPRGQVFDADSAPQRLAARNLMEDLREREVIRGGGPAPYGPAYRRRFADALDRLLAKRTRGRR